MLPAVTSVASCSSVCGFQIRSVWRPRNDQHPDFSSSSSCINKGSAATVLFRPIVQWKLPGAVDPMKIRTAAILFAVAAAALPVFAAEAPSRPKAGPVEIMPLSEIKPGMKATAWTVFQGTEAEPVPIEIIGLYKNAWGPKQDIIVAKMGGKAIRTNVAGGMSGSPVYINGKLIGAVALRLSVFSPDAICGITPIELMLEINEFDNSRPEDAKVPDKVAVRKAEVSVPSDLLSQTVS